MAACERLKREHPDCWVNTHISETVDECEACSDAYPDSADYLAVYEKYGLVGPKFSGGHGVWLSRRRVPPHVRQAARRSCSARARTCSSAAACSASAAPPIPAQRVRMAFGSDVGGGNRFSMLNVLDDAYKIGMINNGTRRGCRRGRAQQDLALSRLLVDHPGRRRGTLYRRSGRQFRARQGSRLRRARLEWRSAGAAVAAIAGRRRGRPVDHRAGGGPAVRPDDGGRRPRDRRNMGFGAAACSRKREFGARYFIMIRDILTIQLADPQEFTLPMTLIAVRRNRDSAIASSA